MRLEKQLKKAQQELDSIQEKIDKKLSKTFVKCVDNVHGKGCGKKTQIKNLIFIQTHWYVKPYSCTGGDYWKEGEGNFICPKCGHRNRLIEEEDERIVKLKYLFKDIKDEYNDD